MKAYEFKVRLTTNVELTEEERDSFSLAILSVVERSDTITFDMELSCLSMDHAETNL